MTKEERTEFEKRLAHKIYILQHPELWEKIRAEKEKRPDISLSICPVSYIFHKS